MPRAAILRAISALAVAVGGLALVIPKASFPIIAAAIGVRVGSPWAGVELTRAVVPVLVAVLLAVLAVRFAVRALRQNATLRDDFGRGGKLLVTTIWGAWLWLFIELLYRQQHLGWATLFGNVGASLVCSSVVLAIVACVDRLAPWSLAPRGVEHVGLAVVATLALLTAFSAWAHRNLVPSTTLLPVALMGLVLLVSGVDRVERGSKLRMFAELCLASALLTGPLWRLVA